MKRKVIVVFMILLFALFDGLISGCGTKKITLTWALFNAL